MHQCLNTAMWLFMIISTLHLVQKLAVEVDVQSRHEDDSRSIASESRNAIAFLRPQSRGT